MLTLCFAQGGFFAGCLVLLSVVGCGGSGEAPCANDLTGRRTLRGHYTVSNEHWLFQPCGSDTALWVDPFNAWAGTKGLDLLSQASAAQPPKPDAGTMQPGGPEISTVYMEIVAEVSPLGVYGHLGELGQELKVVEVLAASATSPVDCPEVVTTVFIDPHPECKP
jgi:hypothetical protein